MVVCAVCGLPMRTQPERNVRVYRCASREKPAGPCGGKRVPADVVETELWEQLAERLDEQGRIENEVEKLKASDALATLTAERASTQRCIAKAERDQQDYVRGLQESKANPRMWELADQQIARIEKERQQLLSRMSELDDMIAGHNAAIERVESIRMFSANARANMDNLDFADKRELLEALEMHVTANGRDWSAIGGVPSETDAGITLHSSVRCVHLPLRPPDRA
jgi:hypothetical protein